AGVHFEASLWIAARACACESGGRNDVRGASHQQRCRGNDAKLCSAFANAQNGFAIAIGTG
ncbi:MAG: hypothetical protein Q9M45_11600, partial [Robiginitomaculum sp.]|nr:hypothetical protein [Robiginitomaculum sp.]